MPSVNSSRRLRSYIALGAPATRCPCDGTESALRVEYGFTFRWYYQRLGIDFCERWYRDPCTGMKVCNACGRNWIAPFRAR